MKLARLLPLLLISTLAITACGKDEAANSVANNSSKNNLLAFVPADTPYLGGNLASAPDDIVDSYLERFEPMFTSMEAEMKRFRQEVEENPDKYAGEMANEPIIRIMMAVQQELDGKLNRAGMESLGFDVAANQVVYGISAFPVMRLSLSDADALHATVQRVLDNAEVQASSLEFQGQAYWRFIPEFDDHEDNSDENVEEIAVYIAILQDHLAVGILPVFAEASILPAFLALEKPANSTAESTLQEINRKFEYTPYGTGLLDFQKLANELTNPESLAGQYITRSGHDLAGINTDQCRQELSSIIAHTPRLFAGVNELTETVIGYQTTVETETSLAAELINLVSDVPAANANSSYLAELALGLKVGAVRDFLGGKATAIVEQPYQCEALVKLNDYALQASEQLNQPIPPMVNNLLGLRAAISRFGSQGAAESAEGLIALHVTQPEMLVGMAQMLLPGLAELNMAAGEPPVQVPADMIPMPGMVVYAAQSKSAIGISVGEGEQSALADFINQEAKTNGTFLSVNYDAATYMDFVGKMGSVDADDEKQGSTRSPIKDMQQSYKDLVDRNDTRVGFNKNGLVIDSKTRFKNP